MLQSNFSSPERLDRRQFLQAGSALAALSLIGCGGGGGGAAVGNVDAFDESLVETSSGRFRGKTDNGISEWLGVPYARPPVGALRFRGPQQMVPGTDVLDAHAF